MNAKVIFRNVDLDKYTKSEPNIIDRSTSIKNNRSSSLTKTNKKPEKPVLQFGENENNLSSINLNISKNKEDDAIVELNKSGSLNYSRYRHSFSGIILTNNAIKHDIEELSLSIINNSPIMKQNSSRFKRFTNQFNEVKENSMILESLQNLDIMSDYDDDTEEVYTYNIESRWEEFSTNISF
jgi:hypothetical protein